MIQPIVGRKMWFFQYSSGHHVGPLDATIACVNNPSYVNLGCLDLQGNAFPQANVKLVQANEPIPNADYCTWTPQQFAWDAAVATDPKIAPATPY